MQTFNPEEILNDFKALKSKLVKNQLYGTAVHIREAEKAFEKDVKRKYADDILHGAMWSDLEEQIKQKFKNRKIDE
jgi:hypothetical protein